MIQSANTESPDRVHMPAHSLKLFHQVMIERSSSIMHDSIFLIHSTMYLLPQLITFSPHRNSMNKSWLTDE